MIRRFILAATASAAAAAISPLEARTNGPPVLVAEKVWYADNGEQHALLGGGAFRIGPLHDFWAAGSYLRGQYGSSGDREKIEDAQGLIARRIGGLDVGPGFRYLGARTRLQPGWEWDAEIPDEKAQRNADICGPFLFLGAEGAFFPSPLGWGLGASWLFKDFGRFDELGYDGSHVALEAVVNLSVSRLRASAGYRFEWFRDLPARGLNEDRFSRDHISGVVAALGVVF